MSQYSGITRSKGSASYSDVRRQVLREHEKYIQKMLEIYPNYDGSKLHQRNTEWLTKLTAEVVILDKKERPKKAVNPLKNSKRGGK